ncbi:MAG: SUMF1/EgtB/PvdO family nonheme iron enzyme [Bernardetiaceae bacterium]|nr:SUMF1/EgtB/PvdO family nonheme iron enzyme [Bernardetiaceae bacterium]
MTILLIFLLPGPLMGQGGGDRAVGRVVYEAVSSSHLPGFNVDHSRGLFIGVNEFSNFKKIPYAVDDAIDLAYLFSMELQLVKPEHIVVLLWGEPVKEDTKKRLSELIDNNGNVFNARRYSGSSSNRNVAGAEYIGGATYLNTLNALVNQGRGAGEDGFLILHAATHGYNSDGVDYILTTDSITTLLNDSAVNTNRVLSQVVSSKSQRRLIFLDACRELFSESTNRSVHRNQMSLEFSHAFEDAKGTAFLSAAVAGGLAYDDHNRKNGVFTGAIIDGLRGEVRGDERGFITVENLAKYVNDEVNKWVRQNRSDASNRSGISQNIDGDARNLPLAVDRALNEDYMRLREQRNRAISKLQQLPDDIISLYITDSTYDWTIMALDNVDEGGFLRELVQVIDDIDPDYVETLDPLRELVEERRPNIFVDSSRSPGSQPTESAPAPIRVSLSADEYYNLTLEAERRWGIIMSTEYREGDPAPASLMVNFYQEYLNDFRVARHKINEAEEYLAKWTERFELKKARESFKQAQDQDKLNLSSDEKRRIWQAYVDDYAHTGHQHEYARERAGHWRRQVDLDRAKIHFDQLVERDKQPNVDPRRQYEGWKQYIDRTYEAQYKHDIAGQQRDFWRDEIILGPAREALERALLEEDRASLSPKEKADIWSNYLSEHLDSDHEIEHARGRQRFWDRETLLAPAREAFQELERLDVSRDLSHAHKRDMWDEYKKQHAEASYRTDFARERRDYWATEHVVAPARSAYEMAVRDTKSNDGNHEIIIAVWRDYIRNFEDTDYKITEAKSELTKWENKKRIQPAMSAFQATLDIDQDPTLSINEKVDAWDAYMEEYKNYEYELPTAIDRQRHWVRQGQRKRTISAYEDTMRLDDSPHIPPQEKIAAWNEYIREHGSQDYNLEIAESRLGHWQAEIRASRARESLDEILAMEQAGESPRAILIEWEGYIEEHGDTGHRISYARERQRYWESEAQQLERQRQLVPAQEAYRNAQERDGSSTLSELEKAESWSVYLRDFSDVGYEVAHARRREAHWREAHNLAMAVTAFELAEEKESSDTEPANKEQVWREYIEHHGSVNHRLAHASQRADFWREEARIGPARRAFEQATQSDSNDHISPQDKKKIWEAYIEEHQLINYEIFHARKRLEYWRERALVGPEDEFKTLVEMESSADYTPAERAAAWRTYISNYISTGHRIDEAEKRVVYWDNLLKEYRRDQRVYMDINITESVIITMVYIRPGSFNMGAPSDETGFMHHDGPITRVQLTNGYFMGVTPITQSQYTAVMGENPSNFTISGNHPVERVSWEDAMVFSENLSILSGLDITLPTEAQWEYACRAGTNNPHYFGEITRRPSFLGGGGGRLEDHGWYDQNANRSTHPVKSKSPNPWGLYDMYGNVYEWTSSIWTPNHPGGNVVGKACPDDVGDTRSRTRTIKGGGYTSSEQRLRSAYRRGENRTVSSRATIGFRIIADNITR